ncbi:cupin domain-containing protein [Paenibacillus doosanensis]|uniref:Cupin domain protein n=1 Tax=Paenibacillus konkukensis TaxID=2020716 RepID=A0ABY4RTS8_9BACL|nr:MULTISPECIES: cupin domain-containing protein [Paenibacillus]MCS7460824.1 cupin domain-containing protein [Paenibacillus doosanensis]UQZ86004.1 Cupin domain protein [Paenibacillus konkukensis]
MSNIGVWENAEPGVKRKIFEPGESIMMMEVHFEANAEGYQHSHPHEQFSYCLKGKLAFTVDGETKVISQGETIYIPSGARHGCKALEASVLLDTFTPVREDLVKR